MSWIMNVWQSFFLRFLFFLGRFPDVEVLHENQAVNLIASNFTVCSKFDREDKPATVQ